MRILLIPFFCFLIITPAFAIYNLKPGDIQITDFESIFNLFGGSVNSMGAVEGSGYTTEFAYSGKQSYKLRFAKTSLWKFEDKTDYGITGSGMKRMKGTEVIPKPIKVDWAVFLMNMGPIIDTSVVPTKVQSYDMSGFRYLVFWVKGKYGNERFRIYLNDVHATTYKPRLKIKPNVRVSKKWRSVEVDLKRLKGKIDLGNITQVGIGFGLEDGTRPGSVFYVDNFILVK